jgi:Lrp/AsnC family transcriptional regulator for asnA, asnC and gidA
MGVFSERPDMPLKNGIDDIDLKILNQLEADARTDLKDIAEKCSLTSSAVLRRVEKLKAGKVIVGTWVELKRGIFGYSLEATVAITAENSKVDQVAQKVRAIPNVMVCAKSIGRYNVFSHVFAKSLADMDNVTHKIKDIAGVRAVSTNIYIDDFSDTKEIYSSQNPFNLDEIDLRLIDELLKDAQAPFVRIAKALAICPETVRQRFEKLRKNGIIIKCSITVDRSKIGYQGACFILISCSKNQSVQSTINTLKELQIFKLIGRTIGSAFDISAMTFIKDIKDLAAITAELEKIPEIENIEVAISTFTYYSYIPKPLAPYKCDYTELS